MDLSLLAVHEEMEFGIPALEEGSSSASGSVSTSMPPPPPPCCNCAAVKRLKTSTAGGAEHKWAPQKCNCVASAVTAQLAEAAAPGGMSVPLTNAIDTLRPRRLFEGAGDDDEDGYAASPSFESSPANVTATSSSDASAAPAASVNGGSIVPSIFDILDDGEEDPEPDAECFSIFRPPDVLVDVSGELGTQYEAPGGFGQPAPPQQQQQQQQQQPQVSSLGGGSLASGSGPLAFMPLGRLRSFSPSPLLHRPCTPLSPFGSSAVAAGEGVQNWAGRGGPSPPPPPMLPESAAASRLDAFRGMHNQSPGLMLASVRHDLALRAADRGGSSCGASSCATPSRAPLPMRPPTPGAPGSNMRRTTSFMGAPRGAQQSQTHQPHRPSLNYCPSHSICHLYTHFPHRACADNFDASPGVTPERSGVVPMSLTDTALMQLTQSLTSISIGPIGQKRSLEERD